MSIHEWVFVCVCVFVCVLSRCLWEKRLCTTNKCNLSHMYLNYFILIMRAWVCVCVWYERGREGVCECVVWLCCSLYWQGSGWLCVYIYISISFTSQFFILLFFLVFTECVSVFRLSDSTRTYFGRMSYLCTGFVCLIGNCKKMIKSCVLKIIISISSKCLQQFTVCKAFSDFLFDIFVYVMTDYAMWTLSFAQRL